MKKSTIFLSGIMALAISGCGGGASQPEYLDPLTIDGIVVDEKATLTSDNAHFTLKVHAQLNLPEYVDQICYRLETKGGSAIESSDGTFTNVPAPKTETQYTVTAYLPDDDTVDPYSETVPVPVAIIDVPPTPPVTVTRVMVQGWLRDLENKSNPLIITKGNTLVSPSYKLYLKGLEGADTANARPHITKVHEKFIYGEWKDIEVIDIACDDRGRLTHIYAKVVYPQ